MIFLNSASKIGCRKPSRRLAAEKAAETVSQLVMWRLTSNLEWSEIERLSAKWANPYELTLAQDFTDRLDSLPLGEKTGNLLIQVDAVDQASVGMVDALRANLHGKTVLGLHALTGSVSTPVSPSVACWVRLGRKEAWVQVVASDERAADWVPIGKFTLHVTGESGQFDAIKFSDALSEGVLSRLVRAQLSKGPRIKGKETYRVRIENGTPLILNGLAILGSGCHEWRGTQSVVGDQHPAPQEYDSPGE